MQFGSMVFEFWTSQNKGLAGKLYHEHTHEKQRRKPRTQNDSNRAGN